MKLKIVAVTLLVALPLASSFAGLAADSGENTGLDDTVFENLEDIRDNGDSRACSCGGGGDSDGGTPD
jgi:hypothetical protein